MQIPIIAEERHFLLVDKPAGLACHRDADGTPALLDRVREQTGIGGLHLVHRLDKLTSGLLLLARDAAGAALLGEQFAGRAIGKFYLALSDKAPAKKQGMLRGDMEKGRNGSWRLSQQCHDPALTQFFSHGLGGGRRLFVVRPLTGRTHQIRVALKALGSPILGDVRYGGAAADRGYLHAYALDFCLDGVDFRYRCPPAYGEAWPSLSDWPALTEPWGLPWPAAPGRRPAVNAESPGEPG
ncbi:pseudouridine synthase [Chitinimonas sp.]|uniref:pseudouridine synthase n=1 Tax=Chitinimonas sp. TaxID=1934313 RepID=UPI0035AFED0B